MKKILKRIITIIIIASLVIGIVFLVKKYFTEETVTAETEESEVIRTDLYNSITTSGYVESSLEEKKALHAGYYFEEIYYKENQAIQEGENILKYTNGSYFVAPYNCVISSLSLPNPEEICTNQHYITIASTDALMLTMQVKESEKDKISPGQEAKIELEILPEKEIIGYVTNISNTATYSSSGSNFDVVIEFQNDGEMMLGMTAKGYVILEKSENAVAVAKEAITEERGQKIVTQKQSDGSMMQVQITTGIENDAYAEVLEGLEEGDIVIIQNNDDETENRQGFSMQGAQGMQGMQEMPDMSQMPQIEDRGERTNDTNASKIIIKENVFSSFF